MQTPLERTYYEQFIKNVKDLSSMSVDELLDEDEYLNKIKLRRTLREQDCSFVDEGPSSLPLLVLDLDETLIHCLKDQNSIGQYEALLYLPGKTPIVLRYNIRPYAREFLEEMSRYFLVYVYTASEYTYARTLLDSIDPERIYVKRIFDRRFCCVT